MNEDIIGAKKAVDTYSLEDPSFDTSRQKKFLCELIEASEEENSEAFVCAIRAWNNTGSLDKVQLKLVVTAKSKYAPEEETAAAAIIQPKEVDLVSGGFEDTGKLDDVGEPDLC